MEYESISSIGQDSHRFVSSGTMPVRLLHLGGIVVPDALGLSGNSDADVVLHAVTNAMSGLTGVNILGGIADRMCLEEGITDSTAYLEEAMKHLGAIRPTHLSIAIECRRPRLSDHIPAMRTRLAELIGLPENCIGITATSGENLTAFGRGEGIQVFCILSASRPVQTRLSPGPDPSGDPPES